MTSGKPDYTRSVSIVGYTIESLPIDIVAQTVGNVTIDIAAQSMGNLDINIAASAVTLDFNLKSSDITLDVDVTAQSVGDISIDIAAQSVGNLDVDIKAQTVDLNIKTSGGVNLVIDKLTQAAYTERRATMSNSGVTPTWVGPTGDSRRGKFFPRGCRGFIYQIGVRCQDAAAAGGTITVYISPYVGAGYLHSGTITVPAGGSSAWRYATFNVMWNYDSLFIFAVSSVADVEMGYDIEGDPDYFVSADAGATWTFGNARMWFVTVHKAMTVGDLPVSGTLTVIPLSLASARHQQDDLAITEDVVTTVLSIEGMGFCEYIRLAANEMAWAHATWVSVWCDGVLAYSEGMSSMSFDGLTASTPGVSLTEYGVDARSVCVLTTRFEFTRKLEIKAVNYDGDAVVSVRAIAHTLT